MRDKKLFGTLTLGLTILLFSGLVSAFQNPDGSLNSVNPSFPNSQLISQRADSGSLRIVGVPIVHSDHCTSLCGSLSEPPKSLPNSISISVGKSTLTREELDVVLNTSRFYDFGEKRWFNRNLTDNQKIRAYSSWENQKIKSNRPDLFFSPNFEKVKGAKIVFD